MPLRGFARTLAVPDFRSLEPDLNPVNFFHVLGRQLKRQPKGYNRLMVRKVIVLGHVVSEQSGMKYCAEWLKSFITGVPIEFIPAVEPFWRPDNPAA